MEDVEVRKVHGDKLREFIVEHDIEKWSSTFLDPSWSHDVIKPIKVTSSFPPPSPSLEKGWTWSWRR